MTTEFNNKIDKIIKLLEELKQPQTELKTSNKGRQLIKKFEGSGPVINGMYQPYLCPANVWTIGWGATKGLDGSAITQKTKPITDEEAEKLLSHHLVHFEDAIKRLVTIPLNQNQFDALVSLVYNIGSGNFTKSTLLRFLNTNDVLGAADQFLVWRKAGGRVMAGLERRRSEERELFLSNQL
jgi:lysozyme